MTADSYITFLLCGIVLVLIDGQILYRSGLRFLGKVYQADSARSMMSLVAVLFHLIVLGAVALISMITVSTGLPIRDLVVKLGITLLLLGVAHGLAMTALMAIRDRRRDEQLVDDAIAADRGSGGTANESAVYPVDDRRMGRAS